MTDALLRFSDTRSYAEERRKLLDVICPIITIGLRRDGKPKLARHCHWCHVNMINRALERVHFDHLHGRHYHLNRLNGHHRLRVIYREWLAAGGVVGKGIVGSCESCNTRRAANTTNKVGRAYTAAGRRKRNRKGQGYTAGVIAYYESQRDLDPVPF